MPRPRTAVMSLLWPALIHIHIHLHHAARSFDYVGLAAGSFASWVGLPGPGEPLLLAAAVLAAKHRLDLGDVLAVAFVSAVAGGIIGWLVGLKAGRRLATAPGPLHSLRLRAVNRGEDIFNRYPVTAILMTPAFVAGIHRVRPVLYHVVNVLSAAAWTAAIGVGGYFIGPPVLDAVDDLGTGATIVVVAVVVVLFGLHLARQYRRVSRTR